MGGIEQHNKNETFSENLMRIRRELAESMKKAEDCNSKNEEDDNDRDTPKKLYEIQERVVTEALDTLYKTNKSTEQYVDIETASKAMEMAVLASDEMKKLFARLINTNGEVSDEVYLEHVEYLGRLVAFSFKQLQNANQRALFDCAEVQFENLTFAGFKSGKTLLCEMEPISSATTVAEMTDQCSASAASVFVVNKLAVEFTDSHSAIEAVKMSVKALDDTKHLWKILLCSKADKTTIDDSHVENRLYKRKAGVRTALDHLDKTNSIKMLTNPKLQYGKLFFPVVVCEE